MEYFFVCFNQSFQDFPFLICRSFIIPGKHHHLNVFLHSIVAGVVASSGFVCLQPDNVQYIYPRTGKYKLR